MRKVFFEHHESPEVQAAIAEANALAPAVEDLVACQKSEELRPRSGFWPQSDVWQVLVACWCACLSPFIAYLFLSLVAPR